MDNGFGRVPTVLVHLCVCVCVRCAGQGISVIAIFGVFLMCPKLASRCDPATPPIAAALALHFERTGVGAPL